MAFAQQQPDQSPAGQRGQREQAASEQGVMWILVARFRHGGDKFLSGKLQDTHTHLLAERNMIIPGLLQLSAPVGAMQDIIERNHRLDHQKVAYRRRLRRGNLALIDVAELGEESDRIFTGTAGYPLRAFLTRYRLQGHGHQRTQPFPLHRRMNSHEADSGLIIGVDVETANGDRISLLINHHLMMRQGIPGVTFRPLRLTQRFTQHLPAELIIDIQLFRRLWHAKVIHVMFLPLG